MIKILGIFLKNAPMVCFSKIAASTEKFKKIIMDFKHKDENIRKVVQDLVKEFLLILFNKDIEVRKNNSEMIFQTCIGDYIEKNNNSEIIILGIISMMKTFTVSKNGKINEIFKENYKTCLDFVFNSLSSDKTTIKILSIQVIPEFCEFLNSILDKKAKEYFGRILNTLMTIYQKPKTDDLNKIAKIVLERISDKLNGTDFNKNEELKVNEQVRRLINQATSHENLSKSYLGWCPFW